MAEQADAEIADISQFGKEYSAYAMGLPKSVTTKIGAKGVDLQCGEVVIRHAGGSRVSPTIEVNGKSIMPPNAYEVVLTFRADGASDIVVRSWVSGADPEVESEGATV